MKPSDPVKPSKGQATRKLLLDAAFNAFAQKGYLQTQISDITRNAGKSAGVLYIHFRNKEALLDAWLDECDRAVPWYQAETSLMFEKARGFIIRGYWDHYAEFGPILDALESAALISAHFRRRQEMLKSNGHAAVARMIRRAQSQGLSRGIDPDLTAIAIGAVISQTIAHCQCNRRSLAARSFDKAAVLEHLDRLVAAMLEGADRTAISSCVDDREAAQRSN